jgi:peptidoglycan glycosyltransferase
MRPYLVREARSDGEVVYMAKPEMLRQAINPVSAQRMRSIMGTSVEIGYAAPVKIPGVQIGGKTGTAEVPGGVPHSWFVAIAPLDQPRFAIAVIVERGGEGSTTALPVARQVLQTALAR